MSLGRIFAAALALSLTLSIGASADEDHAPPPDNTKGGTFSETEVVGIERTATDPSQIGWYGDRGLPSVDNVDQVAGRAALVFALNGADGAFGVKSTADALLPDVVGGVPRP